MKNRTFWLLLVVALILGAFVTWMDSSPGWDDTGLTVGMVFLSTLALGFFGPKYPWLWALIVGGGIPLVEIPLTHNSGAVAALIIAIVGAFAGALGRKFLAAIGAALL